MAKKQFLLPIAALFSALTQNSNAMVPKSEGPIAIPANPKESSSMNAEHEIFALPQVAGENNEWLLPSQDDLFKFVIKRTEEGILQAEHYSHYSHRSHSSHSSHYSSGY